jgi:hypothetical protein
VVLTWILGRRVILLVAAFVRLAEPSLPRARRRHRKPVDEMAMQASKFDPRPCMGSDIGNDL